MKCKPENEKRQRKALQRHRQEYDNAISQIDDMLEAKANLQKVMVLMNQMVQTFDLPFVTQMVGMYTKIFTELCNFCTNRRLCQNDRTRSGKDPRSRRWLDSDSKHEKYRDMPETEKYWDEAERIIKYNEKVIFSYRHILQSNGFSVKLHKAVK